MFIMNKKTKVTDYIVEPVERKVIQNFIHKHHYSHNTNGIQQMECFALFSEGRFGFDKKMIGAALYAIPSMPSTAKKYNPDNPDKCRELRRLCCLDEAPTNTESYFISQTLKWLRQNTDVEVVVSFADLEEGHKGVIYKATNFHYFGQTGKGQALMVDGKRYHARSMNQPIKPYSRELKRRYQAGDEGIYYVDTKPKNIYVYYLSKKAKKKYLYVASEN